VVCLVLGEGVIMNFDDADDSDSAHSLPASSLLGLTIGTSLVSRYEVTYGQVHEANPVGCEETLQWIHS
jgi:hypothetical protein